MKTYDTYEEVPDMHPCRKKPIIVHAKILTEPSRVRSLEGDYKQGQLGDVLMRGVEGELYICDLAIFQKTYDWVKD